MLQVLFESDKGIVNRNNFEWNKNSFSREFKSTTNASEFVDKFRTLTTFDRVCQVALVSQGEHQSPNTILDGDHTSHEQNTSDDGDEDRIVDDSEDPPPAKKAKKADAPLNMMGNAVNSKKVGGFVMLMSLYLQ